MCERATQFRKVKSQTKCISLDYLIHKGIERQHYIVVVCRHRNWSTISFAYTANKAQHWRGKMHTFLEFTCCMHHEWSSRKKVHKTRSTAANRNIVMGFDWKRRRKREREREKDAKAYASRAYILRNVNKRNEQMIRKRVIRTRFASSLTNTTCSSHVNINGATIFRCFSLNFFAFWSCLSVSFPLSCCTISNTTIHFNSKVVACLFLFCIFNGLCVFVLFFFF